MCGFLRPLAFEPGAARNESLHHPKPLGGLGGLGFRGSLDSLNPKPPTPSETLIGAVVGGEYVTHCCDYRIEDAVALHGIFTGSVPSAGMRAGGLNTAAWRRTLNPKP